MVMNVIKIAIMNAVAGQLSDGASTLSNSAQNMSAGADQMNAGAGQIPDVSGNAFSSVTAAVKQLYAGSLLWDHPGDSMELM